jgi:hypothetical protein
MKVVNSSYGIDANEKGNIQHCHPDFGGQVNRQAGISSAVYTTLTRFFLRQNDNRMFSCISLQGRCKLRLISIFVFIVISFFNYSTARSQDEEPSKFEFKGYIKNMFSSTQSFSSGPYYENLIHNRLNLTYYANDNITLHGEMRNRIFFGDFVNNFPTYDELIDANNDYVDLSVNPINSRDMIFNMMIDRAYFQWNKNDLEITIGRQRVNWGVNLVWNPNDWFNAYSFFDFDYEERRGSDAIRMKYYTGVASSIEVAVKMADQWDDFVGATMWKVNKWNYDMQFQGGIAHGDLALGTAWAGNLGLAGFKGEFTYLNPVTDTNITRTYDQMLLGSISVDYSFKSSLYLNGSVLYNSENQSDPQFGFNALGVNTSENFTMRNLSNYRWSAFIQSAYQFGPLVTGSLSVMSFPGSNAFFFNPMFTVSLKQNLDLGVFGQFFFDDDIFGDYGAISKSAFMRVKWSF